uniref:Serine aminopeptidase S33 domain-containing protein n=1 Tax=Phytophthora ramorum TaxID=164328 RepID=H3GG42_PHYRM
MDVTPTNLLSHCDERFFTQTLDHFDVGAPTYQQRYFVCDQHFRPGGVMFFYVGNEADVELYLNHTGLMWENAGEFGAMLVFAEHRYFGKSVPFGKDVTKHMRYLSTEQTLADYAVLITYLKGDLKRDIPVIGFGGSYGDSVVAVHIEGGAHHLDLMFSNPLDPEPPKAARATEKQHMRKRTSEFYAHKAA